MPKTKKTNSFPEIHIEPLNINSIPADELPKPQIRRLTKKEMYFLTKSRLLRMAADLALSEGLKMNLNFCDEELTLKFDLDFAKVKEEK